MKNNEIRPLPQRWPLIWKSVLTAFSVWLAGGVAASSERGYLAVIGPCPLRFLAVEQPRTNKFILPMPASAPEPAHVPAPPAKAPPPVVLPEGNAVNDSVSSGPPSAGNMAPLPGNSAPQDGVVSPQMLMRFFNKSTNGPASVAVPANLPAPQASAPGASSATYSNGP